MASNHPFADSELSRLFQAEHYSQIRDLPFQSFAESIGDCAFDSPFNKFYSFRFREQAPKSFLYGLLLDNDLVEYRVPFCDYDLVDFVSALESTLESRQNTFRIFSHLKSMPDI